MIFIHLKMEMEDYLEFKDYLCLRHDSDIKSFIHDEIILFSDKTTKLLSFGFSKERGILITNRSIYNLEQKSN